MKTIERKNLSKTPAPKADRIKGSYKNPKGSASSTESANKINLSDSIINTLENKREEYNKKHPNNKVALSTLKAVFRRGAGAYSTSHRPTISGGRPNSRSAWAFARVNKFLLKKGGTKVKKAYVQDDDLMEKGAILDSSCKKYISQNESILKTGYYLNLNEFSSMIDPYGQIPLNLNYTLVTYNSGNQDGLSLIDTINPINLQNELAEILNIPLNNAHVVFGLYMEMGKKLEYISQIEGDNILVIDRDKIVCKSVKDDDLMKYGGKLKEHVRKEKYVYLRFGLPNSDEEGNYSNSYKYIFGQNAIEEGGISVFEALKIGTNYYVFANNSNLRTTFDEMMSSKRDVYLVNGEWTMNEGADDEILLDPKTFKVLKKIDKNKVSIYNESIRYEDGGLINALTTSMANLKKNGIVLTDNDETITLIAYNIGNQERQPSLYNKSLIYSSVQPIKSASEIIQNFDSQYFERFIESKIEDYKKTHLIIMNQNEVVYDSNVLSEGGDLGQEITCVNCGWSWNTNQSDASDKYICHKCWFDNRTFYDSDPIGIYKNGGNIENEFDELDNNQLVKTLKSFYSDLSESPIFEYLELKKGDYTLNIPDNEFVIFKKKAFSKIESIKIGRFLQPYFDASKKPLFSRFFDTYKVIGNNLIIKVKDMYEQGGIIDETYNKVLQGAINSDDGAIFLDENGIEVTDEIYDMLRNAEAESVKKSRGLQVGDIITVKGKYGNDDFKGNFRGYTNEGKLIVVYDGGKQMAISKDEYYAEGGKLKKPHNVIEIAEKHEVEVGKVIKALEKGIKKEKEHTTDYTTARTIALHHIWESPKYYDKLNKMEKELNIDEHYQDLKKIYAIGGVVDPTLSFATPSGEPSKLTYLQQVLVRTSAFKNWFGDWESSAIQFIANGRQNYDRLFKNVSKVIDKVTFEPKVVYHGTRTEKEFFIFDVSKEMGVGRPYGYFAHNIEYSQNFITSSQRGAQNSIPLLYQCFINVKNPFYAMGNEYVDQRGDAKYWKDVISMTVTTDKYPNESDKDRLDKIKNVVVSQIGTYIDKVYENQDSPFWLLMARDENKIFKYFLNNYKYDGVFYTEEIGYPYDIDNPAQFTEAVTIFEPSQVKLADGRNLNFDPMNNDIRYEDGGKTELPQNRMENFQHSSKIEKMRNLLTNSKYAEGGEVVADKLKDGNDGKKGGYFEGRSHAEGGIKAYNKDTGQMIEVEGEEVIITKGAVKDPQKREFEGEMLTNREILSRINQSGGGVSFANGGQMESHKCGCSGKKYKYGGEMMDDYSIIKLMNQPFELISTNFESARQFADMLVEKLK